MKEVFELKVENKKNAIKYFPDLFGDDYEILDYIDHNKLRNKYLEYCEKYFEKIEDIDEVDLKEIRNIKDAYNYISSIFKKKKDAYVIKSNLINQLLNSYNILMREIAKYNFNIRNCGSWGDNQNKTNKNILFEISLFYPMLKLISENIDIHFGRINDESEICDFDNQLKEEINKLISMLTDALFDLIDGRVMYSETRDLVLYECDDPLESSTLSELGHLKAKWKEERNNACRTILNFYEKINKINMSLPSEDKVNSQEKIDSIYGDGIINIMSGPNYYCYLNNEEREKLTAKNKMKKAKLKNK